MSLATVERLLETDPDGGPRPAAQARETSATALTELRDLVRGIHPPVLAERGLADAVRAVALDTRSRSTVTVRRAGPAAGRRSSRPPTSPSCEALANAARHAGASRSRSTSGHADGVLRIDVTDDGRGGADPDRGTGLRGVARRLGTFDGVLTVDSPAGGPTVLTDGDAVRVVLAEDLYLLRDGLIRLLEAHGFEIVAAVESGPELRQALREHRPDVSIVDVRLPPTFTDEGLQAALRPGGRRPGLPVLVLSQHVEQLYARELLADGAGGVGYLLKDRVVNADQFIDARPPGRRRRAPRWTPR